jgi:hypothetical protein
VRTTIDLDPEIHEIARRRAFEERRSIGDVISELARRGLDAAAPRRERRLGQFAGLVHIADDFDETPDEILRSLDEPLA